MRRASAGARRAAAIRLPSLLALIVPGAVGCGGSHPEPAHIPPPTSGYSLPRGCYGVRSLSLGKLIASAGTGYAASAGEVQDAVPFRAQATGLGSYLLFDAQRRLLAVGAKDAIVSRSQPGDSAVWTVSASGANGFALRSASAAKALAVAPGGGLMLTDPSGAGPAARFALQPATGCAAYPEAELGATGTAFTGASPETEVQGTIDAHAHVTAFEFIGGSFHCGRPWHPWGVAYALPDCASIQGPQGTLAPVQNFIDFQTPFRLHDTRGWPTFRDWPGPTRLTYEGDYYKGIERAWLAGLRVMVTQFVENEALCTVMRLTPRPCNDMSSVRVQQADLHALQDYIDAQSGGPGKGWLRIVTDPFEARRVINAGKLAVVEGIEVSRLFGCGESMNKPSCTRDQIDQGLQEVSDLGVRTFFPVHKFDNAFGGTKMDNGAVGLLINAANHVKTGSFWQVGRCKSSEHDTPQIAFQPGGGVAALLGDSLGSLLPVGTLPYYGPPPHCNQRGLTELGDYLIRKMIERHFLIELDHMDAATADQALEIIKTRRYSGVISAHGWDSPEENPPIYAAGGMVTPSADAVGTFAGDWSTDRQAHDKRYYFGFGYGSDMNGLSPQSGPASPASQIKYPFKSFGGNVTFDRERWGDRVFDLNKEGVSNYGLYADWLEQLRTMSPPLVTDMFRGAEAYLQMWERAVGVPATPCLPARQSLSFTGLGNAIKLGDEPERLLLRTGQPTSRTGRSYRYCVAGAGPPRAAVFTGQGAVGLIASTAPGDDAAGISPGSPVDRLRGRASPVTATVWTSRPGAGGARFVYGTGGDRVRYVAVASPSVSSSPTALLGELHAAGL